MQAVKAQARAEAADAVASEGSSTTHPKKGALDWVWATETLLHRQGCAAWTTAPPTVSTRQCLECRQLLPLRPQHNTPHHPTTKATHSSAQPTAIAGGGRGAALPGLQDIRGQWKGSWEAYGGGGGATSVEFGVRGEDWEWGDYGLDKASNPVGSPFVLLRNNPSLPQLISYKSGRRLLPCCCVLATLQGDPMSSRSSMLYDCRGCGMHADTGRLAGGLLCSFHMSWGVGYALTHIEHVVLITILVCSCLPGGGRRGVSQRGGHQAARVPAECRCASSAPCARSAWICTSPRASMLQPQHARQRTAAKPRIAAAPLWM